MVPGKRPQSAVAAVKSLSSGGFLQPLTDLKELLCWQAGPNNRVLLTKGLFLLGAQENAGPRGGILTHEQGKIPLLVPVTNPSLCCGARKRKQHSQPTRLDGLCPFLQNCFWPGQHHREAMEVQPTLTFWVQKCIWWAVFTFQEPDLDKRLSEHQKSSFLGEEKRGKGRHSN